MSDKYRDNRSDRSRRDEPVNEIKKQILDAAPDTTLAVSATTANLANRGDSAGQAQSQTEFRPDQVPGHLGYNASDNLLNVNPEIEEF